MSSERIDDPRAVPVAMAFPDNTNGTELMLLVLRRAKALEVTAISSFEIQVGPCARSVSSAAAAPATATNDPALDRIVLRATETRYTCRKLVEQVLVPGAGGSGAGGFSDAQMQVRDECEHTPIEHVVVRYRFEVDHGFVPPDWNEIRRWTSSSLTFGPPRCGLPAKNELRASLHRRAQPASSPPSTITAAPNATDFIAIVRRAKAAADAGQRVQATHLAEQALARLTDRLADGLEDAAAAELASWIAAAWFYAVEADVDAFMRRAAPPTIDDAWAAEVGAEIDRIAARYSLMRDRVRVPAVASWLRTGAANLAKLHRHVATILERGGQLRAAEVERGKAAALDARR